MAKPRKPKTEDQKPDNSGAVVLHQKLCLSIDIDKRHIYGYTELKIAVPESGFVGLHADNMIINSITVDGEPAEFEFFPHYQLVDDEIRWRSVSSTSAAADAACATYTAFLDKEMAPNLLILCCKLGQGEIRSDNGSQTSGEPKQVLEIVNGGFMMVDQGPLRPCLAVGKENNNRE